MAPALNSGDRVLVFCRGVVKEGDTVVFYKNGMIMVKRIIVRESGRWVVAGNNFNASTDSADFGAIEPHRIIGKVIARY